MILESPGKVLKTAKKTGGPGIMIISRKVLKGHGFPFYMDIGFDHYCLDLKSIMHVCIMVP